MRRAEIALAVSSVLFAAFVARAHGQMPASQPTAQRLPASDPKIQQWVTSISQPARSYQELLVPVAQVLEARANNTLMEDQWLTQVLIFLSRIDGEARAAPQLRLSEVSKGTLGIARGTWIKTLAPYLSGPDPQVARVAEELIHASGALIPDQSTRDAIWTWEFSVVEGYLQGLQGADPSWQLVWMMYLADEDAALRTTSRAYLNRDDRRTLDRKQKELRILILSYDLGTAEQRPEIAQKLQATLADLTKHAHWCVRAYALAVIGRSINPARTDIRWGRDFLIAEGLVNDKNPLISQAAASIIQKVRRN